MGYIEENKEIIKELLESKKIKAGQLINYAKFLELYKPYSDRMSEQEFAEILGIKYYNYTNIKWKKERNTKILKSDDQISKEEKELIIQELVSAGKVKIGQSIDYEYFKLIYKPYRDKISEKDFAKILGIKNDNFKNIKSRKGRKAKILKESKSPISEEEKELIIEELLREGKIKPGQLINYEEFKKIYDTYRDKLSEQDFAEILEINITTYRNIKSRRIKNKSIKTKKEIDK